MVLDEDQKVHLAINRLGLATLSPFNPKYVHISDFTNLLILKVNYNLCRERIIEYCLPPSTTDLLVHKTVSDFVTSVGDRNEILKLL